MHWRGGILFGMLDKNDKKFLTENFAAKKELSDVKVDVDELKVDSKLIQGTLIRFEKKVDKSFEFSKKTLAIVEGFAGKVATLDQENKMGSITLRRHGIQIQELATATGTTLSD